MGSFRAPIGGEYTFSITARSRIVIPFLAQIARKSARSLMPSPPTSWAPMMRRVFGGERSEEHTTELQSHSDLVCRLLLGTNNKTTLIQPYPCQLHRPLAHLCLLVRLQR